ncbi:MFS transporter [Pelagibacteraceae bacterium]|jgi:MFS family permease|nr:MFS transporter [Pelagibacteraceae bacterium]MDC0366334.1 MFS transporter [Pelagibacteraceae bacterium]
MYKIIKNSWALFIGYGVIMVSHGFQGNLLGIRAILENFNFIATGTMMSGYFVGYFVGANMIPNLVSKVGHIRVFAAFASMASLSSLVHALFVDPIVWTLARFLTGFSMIGILIIVESWLNDRATNKTRGKVLSLYMFFTFFAFTIGNLLLNISSPNSYEPFILISLLFSVALIPILLTKRKPPTFKKTSSIRIKELLKISPFGSFSMFCTGFIFAAMFAMLSVYAVTMNLTVFEISILLVGTTLAGAIFQWPIGYLSDKYDRRVIVIGCCIASFIFGVLSIMSSGIYFESLVAEEMVRFNYFSSDGNMNKTNLFIFIILLSGMTLPMFALNLALVNDYIPKEKFVAAGAGLNIIFGLGAMAGPIICSVLMSLLGPNGFFIHLFIFLLAIIFFGIYRVNKREYEDNPESTFTPLPREITPLGIELDPDTGVDLSNTLNDKK